MSVVIDQREKPDEYRERAQRVLKGSVDFLPEGDYLICKDGGTTHSRETHMLVERKTTDNLVSSIVKKKANGRIELFDQLERCKLVADRVVLLVEGSLCHDPHSLKACWTQKEGKARRRRDVGYTAVQGALWHVQKELGVVVVWTESYDATLTMLEYLDRRK